MLLHLVQMVVGERRFYRKLKSLFLDVEVKILGFPFSHVLETTGEKIVHCPVS